MPPHFGHLYYLMTLCEKYDKVVIIIGSCYEHGNVRYSISAHLREKMLRAMLKEAKIDDDKYTFEFLPDCKDNLIWYNNLMKINEKHNSEWKEIEECIGKERYELEKTVLELKILL